MSFLDRLLPSRRRAIEAESKLSELQVRYDAVLEEAEAFKAAADEMPPEVEAMENLSPDEWGLRKIISSDMTMSGAGYGYVSSPYATSIQLIWGIERPVDFPKYWKMYWEVPDYGRAVDEMVNLSVMKPYTYQYTDERKKVIYRKFRINEGDVEGRKNVDKIIASIREKVIELDDRIRLRSHLPAVGIDLIVLGNAYIENTFEEAKYEETFASYSTIRGTDSYMNYMNKYDRDAYYRPIDLWFWHTTLAEEGKSEEEIEESRDQYRNRLHEKNSDSPFETYSTVAVQRIVNTRRLCGVKNLDPDFMRIRRDAYGIIHGFVQILAFPPVAFNTDQITHFKWLDNSKGQNSAYGTSRFHAGIRNQGMIWQIENDMVLYGHNVVRFPGKARNCKDPSQQPMSPKNWEVFKTNIKQRKVSSDIIIDGNADFEPFTMAQGAATPVIEYLKYLGERRTVNVGVPPVVLGLTESAGGGGSETNKRVSWNNFIVDLKTIQDTVGRTLIEHTFAVGIEQEIKCDIDDYLNDKAPRWGSEMMKELESYGLNFTAKVQKGGVETEIWEFPLWLMPEMDWEEIGREDKDRLVQRGAAMLSMGAFSPNEVRREMNYADIDEKVSGMNGNTILPRAAIGGAGTFPQMGGDEERGTDRENEKARYEAQRHDSEGAAVALAWFDSIVDELKRK